MSSKKTIDLMVDVVLEKIGKTSVLFEVLLFYAKKCIKEKYGCIKHFQNWYQT